MLPINTSMRIGSFANCAALSQHRDAIPGAELAERLSGIHRTMPQFGLTGVSIKMIIHSCRDS
jgi:hypothetical protein